MRSRSVVLAGALTALSAVGAAASYLRANELRQQAEVLLARGNAEALEYASSFNGALAERQLATFPERRAQLEAAYGWERIQMLLVLTSVVGLFGSYVLYLFHRLREQLVDAAPDLASGPP